MYQSDISVMMICCVPFLGGLLALLFTVYLKQTVTAAPHSDAAFMDKTGDDQQLQKQISDTIQEGAMAFLQEEYMSLIPFVIAMSVFFFVEEGITCENGSAVLAAQCNTAEFPGNAGYRMVVCFIIGACLSALSGYAGMMVATECNVKAAQAAKNEATGLNDALRIAFAGGAVMGFTVVGLGLTGLSVLFWLFAQGWDDANAGDKAKHVLQSLQYMAAFSFGASAIALFARVAGGIYTKAADVGADLVGKVESDFPEDSYYNPATVADNVGDNVGDVAGMGADLFESYVGSIVAAATLAMTVACQDPTHNVGHSACPQGLTDWRRVALPFWVAGFGVIASIAGTFLVSTDAKMTDENGNAVLAGDVLSSLLSSLHWGVYSSSIFIVGLSAVAVGILYHGDQGSCVGAACANPMKFRPEEGWKDFGCIVIGLITGIVIGEATEYFTAYEFAPTQSITKAGITGPATVIIQGLGIGMLSAVPPVVVIAIAVMSTSTLSGVYGAALAAVGMLSTLGVTLATDAYGPVADNAGGVAEMSHLPESVRNKTDALDALGNTTAATGKGFAVGSAVLTALAFMNAFSDQVRTQICQKMGSCAAFNNFFSLTNPLVLSGLLIGAMLPFLFAALTMLSVGTAAQGIIVSVRDQLHGAGRHHVKEGHAEFSEASEIGDRVPFLLKLGIESSKETWATGIGDGKAGPSEDLRNEIKAATGKEWTEIKPRCAECVTVCTQASLKEMILPGVLAIFTPLGMGLLVGARCLGGILMGAIATGFLLAVMMNNAGGAWDNAKKYVENDNPDLGAGRVYKKSHPDCNDEGRWHAAVVVGDTVGDPFKDTSGPALNILIKLMSVLSLTCAKMFRDDWETYWVGIIVLLIEAILCGAAYVYVWGDKDGNALVEKKEEPAPAGTATEMTPLDAAQAEKVEQLTTPALAETTEAEAQEADVAPSQVEVEEETAAEEVAEDAAEDVSKE